MRLTVGPLPAAVYWRRRAMVAGALLLIVVMTVILLNAGGGDHSSSTGSGPGGAGGEPTATSTLFTPTTDEPGGPGTVTSPGVDVSPGASLGVTVAPAGSSGAGPNCTDAEMQLTPSTDPAAPRVGQPVTMGLKIKNISHRTCSRDVGSGPQELRLTRGSDVIWSSDYCQVGKGGSDVRTFGPNVEASFSLPWDGAPVGPGCIRPSATPTAGSYQLTARLGSKWSSPVTVTITGSAS